MIRGIILLFGAGVTLSVAANGASVEAPSANAPSAGTTSAPVSATQAATPASAALSDTAQALKDALERLNPGSTDEERNERAALAAFYEQRSYNAVWFTQTGEASPKAVSALDEMARAGDWGLEPKDFAIPHRFDGSKRLDASSKPADMPSDEIAISSAVLKYARYARGGRITDPASQLSSYLDRKPQLLKPADVLEGAASAANADAYLRGLHPAHPQFEKLRQKYLELPASRRRQSTEGKKLLANMEEWRWMPANLGEVYIWNNIPDFTQRVVKNGEVIRKEHIVTGETGKQTPIFSHMLKKIVFKPTWKVPDSIKVRELWPSLLRGGRLMNQWGLEVRTKDDKPMDWRRMNWSTTDIREYDVVQLNGPKSVMGKVKFSFPNQHTVFMHDTLPRDKWMFGAARRTYSHGCMRVANPLGLATIVLKEDKGWDAARVTQTVASGPLNNEIVLDRKIPIHMTYFTVLIEADGKMQTFPDVYGHERRITQALDGKWNQIAKGRDHLAPVELDLASAKPSRTRIADAEPTDDEPQRRVRRRDRTHGARGGFFEALLGNGGDGL